MAELRSWLRLTPRHPSYRKDVLTDKALALSRPQAAGLRTALALYSPLRRLGLPRVLAAASHVLLDYEGQVVVLVALQANGPPSQVAMGRVLMRQWLALAQAGYATHPSSASQIRPGWSACTGPGRAGPGRPVGQTGRSARLI